MSEAPPKKTPFSEILAWSTQQPLWQQEAVRRILSTRAPLGPKVVKDLADFCLDEQSGSKGTSRPLSVWDLPLADAAAEPVALTGFGHARNVNALRADQWISVGPQLTVIFGNNATGKTGYARVLKKAFRARVVEELQPDVRAEKPLTHSPGATFEFRKGAGAPGRITWDTATPLSPEVASRFAVLDAKCGQAYVVNNELKIAPQGLDVLPRLVEALDGVRDELKRRRAACGLEKGFLLGVDPTTPSAKFIMGIGATTAREKIGEALAFSADDKKRLKKAKAELVALQTQSPSQLAAQRDSASRAARNLRELLVRRAALVGSGNLGRIEAAREALETAEAAARKVKTLAADQKALPEIGNDAWLGLIEAAAQFVKSADEEAEGLDDLGKCPLCLETLSPLSKTRLGRFWSVVTDTAEAQRAQAEGVLERLLAELRDASESSEDDPALALAASLGSFDETLLGAVEAAVRAATAAAQKVRAGKSASQVEFAPVFQKLSGVDEALSKSAATGANAAEISKRIDVLVASVAELEARQALLSRLDAIESHQTELQKAQLLDAALAGIKSIGATKKSSELNETFITDSYRLGVEAELKQLGFARPAPVLVQQGEKGKVRIVPLPNPRSKSVTAEQVFSEGERTAIALASFFSELSLAPSHVGLVFDDPISSLDHGVRDRVAQRLAVEAATRQVIVFTHDLGFLSELTRAAEAHGVKIQTSEISSTSSVVGVVEAHPPWDAQSVAARTTLLDGLLIEARQQDGQGIPHFLALLRSTWERFVEEKLFAGAVERFSRRIAADHLRDVCMDPALVEEVVAQLDALSGLIEGRQPTVAVAQERLKALKDAVARHTELRPLSH